MKIFQHNASLWLSLSMLITDAAATIDSETCLNILLTNDDGYETILTNSLFRFLRDETCHKVKMVAPKGAQSGKGGAIDIFVPNLEEGNPETDVFFLDSTPATTVLYGLDIVCPEADFKPDLVLAGPNEGWNIGWVTHNSGTVNAAVAAMTKGYSAVAISASPLDAESEDAAVIVAELVSNLIETKLLENGKLILGAGEGLNVNIPTVSGADAKVDDYSFKLTKIGRGNPFGGAQYFRDLKDSNINQLFYGGYFNGFSGLGFTLPYTDAGYPADTDSDTENNAFGNALTERTFVVTVSPMEYNFDAEPSLKLQNALGEKKNKKSGKGKKKGKKRR